MKIIKDTREQLGWNFPGMEVKTLHTGDYTIEGYENLFVIERKGKLTEFVNNLCTQRFEEELKRLEEFKYSFIICEFEYSDIFKWPLSSGLSQNKVKYIKTSKYFVLKRVNEILVKYKTKIIFAGKNGADTASSIFKRVVENENNVDDNGTKKDS